MLRFAVRRALVQRRMLGAVVVLITAASTLLGVASLLLGETQDRAFAHEIDRTQPQDLDVTAFLVDVAGPDLEDARHQAQDVVGGVLATMDPTLTSSATTRMRLLEGEDETAGPGALGYLATIDAPERRADLTSGRWPAEVTSGPPEAAVPDAAADRLGLALGDRVELGRETGLGAVQQPVTVVLVGTYRPKARSGWDSDPLSGAGFVPGYSDGSVTGSAFGPFLVTDAVLEGTGSSISGVRVSAAPDLRLADDASLRAAATSLGGATRLLSARVEGRAHITRVASDLPTTLTRVHAQQDTTPLHRARRALPGHVPLPRRAAAGGSARRLGARRRAGAADRPRDQPPPAAGDGTRRGGPGRCGLGALAIRPPRAPMPSSPTCRRCVRPG